MPDAREGNATLIIGQRVRRGKDDEYVRWQKKVDTAVSRSPGFTGSELRPPTETQPDWVQVYHFDSAAHVLDWLNSGTRQALVDRAAELFDGPATRQVIARDKQIDDALVTVVVSHKVAADKVDEFLDWHRKVVDAESRYPGYRGSEVFRPIEGVQDEWTICYRFDNAENLNAWLTSEDRKNLISNSEFADFHLRTIDHSFGNWFEYGDKDAARPSDFKTSMAVWMGLYPTVVFLTLLTSPLHMKLWLAMLVGNLLSSFVMSYLVMPYYANPLLRWWIRPAKHARQPRTNIAGILLVLAINVAWAVVFYLITAKFWTLP